MIARSDDGDRQMVAILSAVLIDGPVGKQHWIADLPEFLTKRPDEDVRLLAEEQSELVNIP
jgi:hypothetical protein